MTSQKNSTEVQLRRKLLGTASALAALSAFQVPTQALAADASDSDWHLTLDIGGQYAFNSGGKTQYADFGSPEPKVGVANGGNGQVALNLETDGWIFGLKFNFGRTGDAHAKALYVYDTYFSYYGKGEVRHSENHKMLDFTVGQDVGLGMFGLEGSSVVSGGVRWANFSAVTVGHFSYGSKYNSEFRSNFTSFNREIHRSFNGIGPVISWAASTPIGDPGCHLSFDWGVDAAVLFGSRKAWENLTGDFSARSRNGTVPQASGYLGLGWHPDDSRFSFHAGYAVQASWGVFDSNFDDDSDDPRINHADRISHGPYLDVTMQLK